MNAGDVASRVYDGLKREIMSGDLAPGTRLDPTRLADKFSSSATPVREALSQLTGERLVETRPSEGFFLPGLRETELRDLYRWSETLAKLAARRAGALCGRPLVTPTSLPTYGDIVRMVFEVLGKAAESEEIAAQLSSICDRLAAVRRAEIAVGASSQAESDVLLRSLEDGDLARTAKLFVNLHRKWLRSVPTVVAQLYRR